MTSTAVSASPSESSTPAAASAEQEWDVMETVKTLLDYVIVLVRDT